MAASMTVRQLNSMVHTAEDRPCAAQDADTEAWFPIGAPRTASDVAATDAVAARLCAGCPVLDECRELAWRYEATRSAHGIWGGLSDHTRAETNPYRAEGLETWADPAQEQSLQGVA